MKYKEIAKKSGAELKDIVRDAKKENFNLRLQASNGEMVNAKRPRELRKNIARAKTALSVQKKEQRG